MKYLLALWVWVVFITTTCLLFVVLCGVYGYQKLFNPEGASNAAHAIATFWGRTIFNLVPAWTYRIDGAQNIPGDGRPYVLVANHQSTADIWALYLIGHQFRWLSKDTMFRVPLVGLAMRWAGYVSIKRGNKSSQYQAIEDSRAWLRRGVSMCFFPEGTRSEDGSIREFKTGAFRLAQEEQVPILPVVLSGTRELIVKNSGFPKKAHVHIEILPPVESIPGEDTKAFASRVQAMIADGLKNVSMEKKTKPLSLAEGSLKSYELTNR